MRKLIFAALPLLVLAGCQSGGVGMAESPAWFATTSPEQQAAYFGKRCATYGFKPGTPEMAYCIQREASGARGNANARVVAAQQAISNSTPRPTAPGNRTYTCTNVPAPAGMTKVNCY